jgi:O-succinylbenzoic acid--CoA ligase
MMEAWVAAQARRHGDAIALRDDVRVFTWTALANDAAGLAASLQRNGVSRGDVVAVRMKPQPRMVAMLHALQMLGAAMLPLNLRLTADELERVISRAGPRLVIDEGDATPDASATRNWWGGHPHVHPFDLVALVAPKSAQLPDRIDPFAALTIVLTSGSSAVPKAVVLTNANYAASAAASRVRLGHGRRDVWLATLPLFHVGGLAILARSALEGSEVALEPAFDADRAVDALSRRPRRGAAPTMVSLVPTMLARVLDRMKESASPALRCVLVGGAPLSPALGQRALEAGLPVSPTYGMTEACSQIATSAPGSADAARGVVGRPLDGVHVGILEADSEGWGEICVRGATVMAGYLRARDEREASAGGTPGGVVTAAADDSSSNDAARAEASQDDWTTDLDAIDPARMAGGWLRTRDRGRFGEDGSLAVAGRCDDVVITGGENVAPVEVEQALELHAGVAESLVFGESDDEWGQRVVALVVTSDGPAPSGDELGAWCRERIAAFKVPREFRFVRELPRTATGKLRRGKSGTDPDS